MHLHLPTFRVLSTIFHGPTILPTSLTTLSIRSTISHIRSTFRSRPKTRWTSLSRTRSIYPIPRTFRDPFADDVPSLFPDPFDDLPDLPELPLPEAQLDGRAAVASNVLTRLMPFPMRIPFHPAYSGRSAAPTGRNCNAATASKLIIPESNKNTAAFLSTCPPQRTATVRVGTYPVKVAPTPDGTQALVANNGDGNTSGTVSVINIATQAVSKTITFPAQDANGSPVEPNNVAFLPDGSRAYVSSHACNPSSFIYIIDMPSLTITGTIPVACFPSGMAVTPDGSQLWVAERGSSRVDVFDTAHQRPCIRV